MWAVTGEALALVIASDVPFTSSSHGINSGAHGEAYSKHTSASGDRRQHPAACPTAESTGATLNVGSRDITGEVWRSIGLGYYR